MNTSSNLPALPEGGFYPDVATAENNAQYPTVEFDGTFEGFIAEEERLYGLTRPKDA